MTTEEIDGSPVTSYREVPGQETEATTEDGRSFYWEATRTPETEGPDYGQWIEIN